MASKSSENGQESPKPGSHDFIADTLDVSGTPLTSSCRNCGAKKDGDCDDNGSCPGSVYVRKMSAGYASPLGADS